MFLKIKIGLLSVRIVYLFSYSLLDPRWLLFVLCGSSGVVEGKFSLMNQGVGVKIITSRNIMCLVEDDGFSG